MADSPAFMCAGQASMSAAASVDKGPVVNALPQSHMILKRRLLSFAVWLG